MTIDYDKIRSLAQQIIDEVGPIPQPPADTVIKVTAGSNLQTAHDNAPEGATLQLEDGTYEGHLNNNKKLTWTTKSQVIQDDANPSYTPVTIHSQLDEAVINTAKEAVFEGICFRADNKDRDIFVDNGLGLILNKVVMLGGPNGQHRGLLAHGVNCVVKSAYIDDIGYPGRDASAIGGYNGTNGLIVESSYLGGAAQSLFFGGGDYPSEDKMPQNIVARKCRLTKKLEWYGKYQIKCAFELKAAKQVLLEDCILEYAGMDGGSAGYIVQLTPRNQNNKTPSACVKDVTLRRCTIRYGGGAINLLGSDNNFPSGPLRNVLFENCLIDKIDKTVGPWKGSGNIVAFNRTPDTIKFNGLTVRGNNLNSIVYITGVTPGFQMTNAILAKSTYTVKIDNGGQGWDEFKRLNPDAVVNITANDTGAVGYPV